MTTLVVAAVLAVSAPATSSPAPDHTAAATAPCPTDHGVTVVVDFNEIGGPDRVACVSDGGGRPAADLFTAAGFPLEYQPQLPDFVCRVDGEPTDRPCAESDSFWSLWWSDGSDGSGWVFSTLGASGLEVPDGGILAFAWHEGDGDAAPPDHAPTTDSDTGPGRAAETDPTATDVRDDARGDSTPAGDDDPFPTGLVLGAAVLVLAAAAAVPILRRRRG